MAVEEKLLLEQSKVKQLEIELEKFKKSSTMIDDTKPEPNARENGSTGSEQPSASIKARIHCLFYGP